MDKRIRNLSGNRFGRLCAIKIVENPKSGGKMWLCLCDCGNICCVLSANLIWGHTKSCGCLRKERTALMRKLPKGQAVANSIYKNYRHAARKRNILFDLSKNEFMNLVTQNCFYCNKTPSQELNIKECNGSFIYNGIDRVDNLKGYNLDNCVPCCGRCNKAKNNMTLEEFINLVDLIHENVHQKKYFKKEI